MFVEAIEKAGGYTRAVLSITRNYGSTDVIPGAATLFFVNKDGWALTCRHVTELLAAEPTVAAQRAAFKAESANVPAKISPKEYQRRLAQKYGYTPNTVVDLKTTFVQCVQGDKVSARFFNHPTLDVALLHFENAPGYEYTDIATFPADTSGLKPGLFLCRLGFPFSQFSNFAYDPATDDIQWTNVGGNIVRFPLEGMVTRDMLLEAGGPVTAFEMSTPGLRGQSGGPAFDSKGVVWGMQAATQHLDLDFDVKQEVFRNGQRKLVTNSPFLHVGHCVHVNVLKDFMRQLNVAFTEV